MVAERLDMLTYQRINLGSALDTYKSQAYAAVVSGGRESADGSFRRQGVTMWR